MATEPTPGTVYQAPFGSTVLVAGTTPTHITAVPVATPRGWCRSRGAHTVSDVRVTAPRGGTAAISITRRTFAQYQPVGIARPA
ncbi:hypothetical protein AW27_023655 [Streptomyces sp. PCS3-D2]|uniref:hypothetical protein n=1 Tax=Streptomyces sp. PCS3-D2 TaxID=1460244 RepID=UPI00272D9A1A|nr:hypothetical protein [Streptomyces sp. PCS3-D2]WKV74241.1 hypothetical protein AW27_023655 [Streptomyces sp. PCS3-D2]